jgi:PleD family two-component response regulator
MFAALQGDAVPHSVIGVYADSRVTYDGVRPTVRSRIPPRILVVEDDAADRGVRAVRPRGVGLRRVLERWGYGVVIAASGEGALEHVRRWPPDLVEVDQLFDSSLAPRGSS